MENQDALKTMTLATGQKMPTVGYGCWKVGKDVLADTVYEAIKAGYRLIDEACDYGNEVEAGVGIKRAIDEGIVKREDLFVTSKLWQTFHSKDHVEAACRKSLKDLGLDYLDLYLIHFPIALKYVDPAVRYPPGWTFDDKAIEVSIPYQETWQAMEALADLGLTKAIGCSNILCQQLRDVFSYARIRPAVLQVEMHPHCVRANLLKYCNNNNVKVTAYSSFGGGSWIELGMAKEADVCYNDPVIKSIAEVVGKTGPQVALRWAVQRGTAVIPKSINTERIAQNFDLFSFTLTDEQMATIDGLDKNRVFNDPGAYSEGGFNCFLPIFD